LENYHQEIKDDHDLLFLDFGLFDLCVEEAATGLPNKPQKPHVETLGEGGSIDVGATLTVRYGLAPADLLLSNVPVDALSCSS